MKELVKGKLYRIVFSEFFYFPLFAFSEHSDVSCLARISTNAIFMFLEQKDEYSKVIYRDTVGWIYFGRLSIPFQLEEITENG